MLDRGTEYCTVDGRMLQWRMLDRRIEYWTGHGRMAECWIGEQQSVRQGPPFGWTRQVIDSSG
jgi:hypothetical protein